MGQATQEPAVASSEAPAATAHLDWPQVIVFLLMHVACLGVFVLGGSLITLGVAFLVVLLQGFGVTAFYHRYFAHRAFKTSRAFQFCGAILGNLAMQRDPLWWVSQHRLHHLRSDTPADPHSPRHTGLLWSHMIWFMDRAHCQTEERLVRDYARYPELQWLKRNPFAVPIGLAATMFGVGVALQAFAPHLGIAGLQLLLWGWLLPTMITNHITYCVNSWGHRFGRQDHATGDDSRNSFWLALLTLGEGWHNNHHRYPGSARHGFHWWQVDFTYGLLCLLSCSGLIWNLRPVPDAIRNA